MGARSGRSRLDCPACFDPNTCRSDERGGWSCRTCGAAGDLIMYTALRLLAHGLAAPTTRLVIHRALRDRGLVVPERAPSGARRRRALCVAATAAAFCVGRNECPLCPSGALVRRYARWHCSFCGARGNAIALATLLALALRSARPSDPRGLEWLRTLARAARQVERAEENLRMLGGRAPPLHHPRAEPTSGAEIPAITARTYPPRRRARRLG